MRKCWNIATNVAIKLWTKNWNLKTIPDSIIHYIRLSNYDSGNLVKENIFCRKEAEENKLIYKRKCWTENVWEQKKIFPPIISTHKYSIFICSTVIFYSFQLSWYFPFSMPCKCIFNKPFSSTLLTARFLLCSIKFC